MTRKTHSAIAFFLAVLMVLNLAGTIAVAAPETRATDVMQNDNQSSGVVLTKGAKANDDGTVDVTIEAYTTGKVTNTSSTVPTDIVLVLDVSGSMADRQEDTYKTEYVAVDGEDYERYSEWWWRTFYGFRGNENYYILVDGEYIVVHKEGFDSNRYDYYYSDVTNKNYYPILNSSITPDRKDGYDVVQFYTPQSVLQAEGEVKLDVMQKAVTKFIRETATKNSAITDTSKQHRISIVKFAGDQYYTEGKTVNGNTTVANAALSENFGDNKYNRSTYNYTQVVMGLTSVNDTNVNSFTAAVSNLVAGGATAVDYGVALAEQVLYDRTNFDKASRKEVVIVFTDGVPTHGSSYSSSVAATAVNHASSLKKADAVVYSISMDSYADATVLEAPDYENGNKFMHYISSNFPNATASGTTIVPGDGGNIGAGYYMTPSEDKSLEMIFDTIVHQIGAPTISLGEEATIYDHVSNYFDLNGTLAENVKTQTSARKADGTWDVPQNVAITVKQENNNSTIIVSGFDFDKNYISDEPRDANFYGKKLIIKIKLKPDYEAIERHKSDILATGGWVSTNNGNALIEDTHDNIAARVASPAVLMNKITYLVDGKEYDYSYLMPTDEHTLIEEPTEEGHAFSGWSTDDVVVSANKFTMPAKDVVINGSFTAKEYTVNYKYNIDTPPSNWPPIPESYNFENGNPITHTYGDKVTIKDPIDPSSSLVGYKFVGWTSMNQDLEIINNEFEMPAHNITFIGHFEPEVGGTEYKVQHFLEIRDEADDTTNQIINGRYSHKYFEVDDTSVVGKKFGRVYEDTRKGTAGETEKISWVEYHGFKKLEGAPSLLSGDPDGGALVLKLYYTRNTNNVSYEYAPVQGLAMPAAPVDNTAYYYGQMVTAATADSIPGYKFTGWIPSVSTESGSLTSGGTFPMPDLDIHFVGHYTPDNVNYKVEYYCETLTDGVYEKVEEYKDTARTGDKVSAIIKHYDGFHLNPTHTNSNEDDTVRGDGSTVLKVYYDRESYKVSYAWLESQSEYIDNKYTMYGEESIKFGDSFKIKAKLLADDVEDKDTINNVNYTFNGWYSQELNVHPETDLSTNFTMPNHNVTIYGGFVGVDQVKETTVTYDKHDPVTNELENEPSQDTTQVDDYIIVDPNGGSWTHNENLTDTTYVAPVNLLMAENRTLETAEKSGYEFVGWLNVGATPEVLANYSTLPNVADTVHVYIAQYKVVSTPPAPGGGGGGVIRYTLTYESNGGTQFKSETYSSGRVVEITNIPAREGYTFDGWHTNVGLTELVKSVTMNRDITVYAAWIIEKEYVQEEDDITSPVPDMLDGDNHQAYIIGYEDGTVRPNANITRAEVSAIFFRLLKSDIRNRNITKISQYSDVDSDKWYNTAIATMSKLGILKGIGSDKFAPNAPITRAEFAVICARFDDAEITFKEDFTDIAGHWAETEIHEAAARGWIKGYEDKTFRPNNPITRAEAMVLINRVLHRVPKTVEDLFANMMVTWPDNKDKSKWYYIAIQEATNSHDYERITDIYEKWTKLLENFDWAQYQK